MSDSTRAKYENLEEEKEKLVEEMLSEIEKDYAREKERTRELNNENQQLAKYIDKLQNESLGISRGAGIPDLKTKQGKNRKLKELKTRAQKALNFVEIFGLDLQLLKLKDPNSTDSFTVDFSATNHPNPQQKHGSVASQNQDMKNFIPMTKTQWKAYSWINLVLEMNLFMSYQWLLVIFLRNPI